MSISLAHKQMFEMRGRPTKKPASFRASQRASTGAFLEARLHADDFDIAPFAEAVSDRRPEKQGAPTNETPSVRVILDCA